jgi:nicotinamide-nucleotide amidase
VCELRFTVFLVPPAVLEKRLARFAAADVLWRYTSRDERHVVVLSAAEETACRFVYAEIAREFGSRLVREGDWDYLPAFLAGLRAKSLSLVTAESCTGGLMAKLLTDTAGSSDVFWGAFVTYSNEAKTRVLGVGEDILRLYGAVSAETVRAMTKGALAVSGASAAIAVSGVAGPGGGSAEKPVGTVWIGARLSGGEHKEGSFLFSPPRARIRLLGAYAGLFMLEGLVSGEDKSIDIKLPFEYI